MNKQWIALLIVAGLFGVAYAATAATTRAELVADEPQGGGGGNCFWERINQVANFNATGGWDTAPLTFTFVYPLDQPYLDATLATHFIDMTITGPGRTDLAVNGQVCSTIYTFQPGELPPACVALFQPGRNTIKLQFVTGEGLTTWRVEKLYLGLNVQSANC